ncbi:hypothetical protein TNCV_804311 [Trichonephila clavipes]|nr:hypothetical protein TNCV_804311 [Trichonephila clavipes]
MRGSRQHFYETCHSSSFVVLGVAKRGTSIIDVHQGRYEASDMPFVCGREALLYVTTKDWQSIGVVVPESTVGGGYEMLAQIDAIFEGLLCFGRERYLTASEVVTEEKVPCFWKREALTVWGEGN